MMIFLVTIAVLILAASILADYKWHRWIATRRQNQDE